MTPKVERSRTQKNKPPQQKPIPEHPKQFLVYCSVDIRVSS
jgi:hypothetical protein